ncbi:MAG: amino acid adenylation domain-containing protein [Planctomycetes bacterium]|nr:amino acid adenylation domain-containing protein [Planctomycetota bacterium]
MSGRRLQDLLASSVAARPDAAALIEAGSPGPAWSYRDLAAAAAAIDAVLAEIGVGPGDRVGIHLAKSQAAVAALFAVLGRGAAYVPLDVTAPVSRLAWVARDCGLRALVGAAPAFEALVAELDLVPTAARDLGLSGLAEPLKILASGWSEADHRAELPAGEELAYILYTSGSTGRPKGVMHSHRSALAFVDWCSEVFEPRPEDVFSSHAPFHFDLSILDLYVSLKHGASLVLIGEELGKQPRALAPIIAEHRISIWYSTPSILSLLCFYGRPERSDCTSLRLVLFAGEVFPLKNLNALRELWPWPRYANLYGPTETNVCTWYELPEGPITADLPIGAVCAPDRGLVVDPEGRVVAAGEEGELVIAGGTVMKGYWNLPERSAGAFLELDTGAGYYRTGDLVRDRGDGQLLFVGRRDRMVKRRGYRVELGEIEAALCRLDEVYEAAAVALVDAEGATLIRAFVVWRAPEPPALVAIKKALGRELPLYMLPDSFVWVENLPKNANDKIDYEALKRTGS